MKCGTGPHEHNSPLYVRATDYPLCIIINVDVFIWCYNPISGSYKIATLAESSEEGLENFLKISHIPLIFLAFLKERMGSTL